MDGILAVSRAFGDSMFKRKLGALSLSKQAVTASPDCTSNGRSKDDQFVVIACDGIWDVRANITLCNFIEQKIKD